MRAPIGLRISSRRKALQVSQAELARRVGISPSYLNLIERNRRDVGGALLLRIAAQLGVEIGALTGEAEHRLMADLQEAFADPVLQPLGLNAESARELVATQPQAALAIARLHRAQASAQASAEDYANRLRSDPILSQLLHRVLSGITAVRSGAEILRDVPDLQPEDRSRFLSSMVRDTEAMTEVARNLIGQFDREAGERRSVSPIRELDDLIFERDNYFAQLEEAGARLREDIEGQGVFGEAALVSALSAEFGVSVRRSAEQEVDALGFPGQYHFNPDKRAMWFHTSATAATRQFQLTRLYVELSAPEAIEAEAGAAQLTTDTSRRLAYRALGSYLAGAVIFPYSRFLRDAEAARYDIERLRQAYGASFEQVAHRLVTLRRPQEAGVPFGFLRSDPAGRLTKHFPLPGLLLPNAGHSCPLWALYDAFRTPETLVRQVAQFADGSRYLFIARTASRGSANFRVRAVHTSVMLACNVLHADRTVYAAGLDLADSSADVPVGPACRLCTRRDCPDRQEEAPAPGGGQAALRAPLVPRGFDRAQALGFSERAAEEETLRDA